MNNQFDNISNNIIIIQNISYISGSLRLYRSEAWRRWSVVDFHNCADLKPEEDNQL